MDRVGLVSGFANPVRKLKLVYFYTPPGQLINSVLQGAASF